MARTSRRHFLRRAAIGTGAVACGSQWDFWDMPPVSAAQAQLAADAVQFTPDIEPLVRLIEETPRERVVEEVVARVTSGLSYREVLAALLLAGIRNVQPRPAVGFKFHAVLVVNSAHLASLASSDADRWLPMLWAIDNFKGSQQADEREGNWTMSAVREGELPDAAQASVQFRQAMERWDESAADVSVAQLARTQGADQLFETFAWLGCRDFRSIGHKAIYVANAFRTLETIGWRYSEPVMRSLAYALLNHEGDPNPASSDLPADRAGRQNRERLAKIRPEWQGGRLDDGATREMLVALRTASPEEASDLVVDLLNRQVAPQSLFDSFFLSAGEMLMRQPAIVALHAVTTTNALRYSFDRVSQDETRRMLLLQNAAFLTMFRQSMQSRGAVADVRIDELQPLAFDPGGESTSPLEQAQQQIFREMGGQSAKAAGHLLQARQNGLSVEEFMRTARHLVFQKGNDSHDYKFSSAVLEDYYQVSPAWRDRFLASSVFKLRGAQENDNGLADRVRQALA